MCEGLRLFLFTVTKPGLRQAGRAGSVRRLPVRHGGCGGAFSGGAVTASAAAVPGIETTQDIGTYLPATALTPTWPVRRWTK